MQDLKITLVQSNIIWEDVQKNLSHLDVLLNDITETDILLLPEMFTTGFSMNPHLLAEKMQGVSMQWMHKIATQKKCIVAGSLMLEEKNKYYNRFIWMRPDGIYLHYDKRHLFSLAEEHKFYTSGEKKIFPEIDDWKILPLICYDLRFPIWSRQTSPYTEMGNHPYDVLMYVASWPEKRIYAWQQLLIARAIENQCFVIGVNRVGEDGNHLHYNGGSCVINAMGEKIYESIHEESVQTIVLQKKELINIRTMLPFLNDRDEFELKV